MITVTLETAKALKEAGWNKPTVFAAFEGSNGYTIIGGVNEPPHNWNDSVDNCHSAPTLQELLEELPVGKWTLEQESTGGYYLGYFDTGGDYHVYTAFARDIVQLAANLWITLRKEGKV